MNPDAAPRRLRRAEAVLATRRRDITLVLDDVADDHNLSAVLRTCEAFGIQDLHVVAPATAQVNTAVSIGAERWLTLYRHASPAAAIAALRGAGYGIHVSQLSPEAVPLGALPRRGRAAFVFGNEQRGVAHAWLEAADVRFRIPTSGFTGSLNLSVAAAIVVYDRLLVASTAESFRGDLSAPAQASLRTLWYETLAHGSAALEQAFRAHLQEPPAAAPTFPKDRNQASR